MDFPHLAVKVTHLLYAESQYPSDGKYWKSGRDSEYRGQQVTCRSRGGHGNQHAKIKHATGWAESQREQYSYHQSAPAAFSSEAFRISVESELGQGKPVAKQHKKTDNEKKRPQCDFSPCFQVGEKWFKPNYHAHIVFDWMNHDTGKSRKLNDEDMTEMQSLASDILLMERGQSKAVTGKEHLERNDFIIEKQKAELQRMDAAKRHKEEQIGLAEQELKQVKSEIRTDKLKKTATNAATAIASGVGSLFGSGKLKDLEQANEKLRQEVVKRDKGIDALKAKMQQMQEQHGKQIRNLQGIHNQELEAKDMEISRLNTLLEKAHRWFPMFKEMLRMEKLCAVIGFTKDMIESLLTKKEAIQCSGKIYSEEHRRKFDIKNDVFRVEKHPMDSGKLILTINRIQMGEWFKEQFDKLRQSLRRPTEEPRKSRGFKL